MVHFFGTVFLEMADALNLNKFVVLSKINFTKNGVYGIVIEKRIRQLAISIKMFGRSFVAVPDANHGAQTLYSVCPLSLWRQE